MPIGLVVHTLGNLQKVGVCSWESLSFLRSVRSIKSSTEVSTGQCQLLDLRSSGYAVFLSILASHKLLPLHSMLTILVLFKLWLTLYTMRGPSTLKLTIISFVSPLIDRLSLFLTSPPLSMLLIYSPNP